MLQNFSIIIINFLYLNKILDFVTVILKIFFTFYYITAKCDIILIFLIKKHSTKKKYFYSILFFYDTEQFNSNYNKKFTCKYIRRTNLELKIQQDVCI